MPRPQKKVEPFIKGFADMCLYFGPFGAASKVKLVNNLLVAINIAATAEAMTLGLKAGVDVDLMIKAVASGSGGSTQFGIRAPWMAQRKFQPVQGAASQLFHYFDLIGDWADFDQYGHANAQPRGRGYQKCVEMGLGDSHDVAVLVDVVKSMPREKH